MDNKKTELGKKRGKLYLKEVLGILVVECRYEEEVVGRVAAIDTLVKEQTRV